MEALRNCIMGRKICDPVFVTQNSQHSNIALLSFVLLMPMLFQQNKT